MGDLHRSVSKASDSDLHAGCWSHARRKFVDSIPENDKNSKAAKAVDIIDQCEMSISAMNGILYKYNR